MSGPTTLCLLREGYLQHMSNEFMTKSPFYACLLAWLHNLAFSSVPNGVEWAYTFCFCCYFCFFSSCTG